MSDAATNRAKIVNRALALLGQAPTFSVDSTDRRAGHVDLVWPQVVGRCFGIFPWSWATASTALVRRSDAPIDGFDFAFDLPSGMSGPSIRFYSDGDCRAVIHDFRLEGTELHARSAAVWAVSPYPVDPGMWDEFFAAAFVVALASALAIPLQHDVDSRDRYAQEAFGTPSEGGTGGLFGRLMSRDRAAQPVQSPFLRGDPLTNARYLP